MPTHTRLQVSDLGIRLRTQPPLQLALNLCSPSREPFATPHDQLLTSALVRLDGRNELGTLEAHRASEGLSANEGFVSWKVDELLLTELVSELTSQVLRIGVADLEGDEVAHVAEDGIAHSW